MREHSAWRRRRARQSLPTRATRPGGQAALVTRGAISRRQALSVRVCSRSQDHKTSWKDTMKVEEVVPVEVLAAMIPQFVLSDAHAPLVTVSIEEQALAPAIPCRTPCWGNCGACALRPARNCLLGCHGPADASSLTHLLWKCEPRQMLFVVLEPAPLWSAPSGRPLTARSHRISTLTLPCLHPRDILRLPVPGVQLRNSHL